MPDRRLIAAALAALLLPACGSSTDPGDLPDPVDVSFAAQVQPIFDANCAGCHVGADPNPQGGLDLDSGQAWFSLVDVFSQGYPGFRRVVPGEPDSSVLYQKLMGNPDFGDRMPRLQAPLPSRDISTIRVWIEEGAEDN